MTHKRTHIRQAVTAALTGLPTCGANVFASRLRPMRPDEVPAILVSTGGEDIDTESLALGIPNRRLLACRLTIVVKETESYEDTADAILEEIEGRLFDTVAHNTFDGLALSTSLESIGDPEMDDSTEKPVIRLPINLRINYF